MRLMKAASRLAAAAPLLFPLSACATLSSPATSSQPASAVGQPYRINGRLYRPHEDLSYDRTGVASWYGPRFHGRRTASGELYDMNALTAAHPTLPLATMVRVTNLANGRSVTVRINDRGPFALDRIIDLSHAGARALGFDRSGVARVRVTVLPEAALRRTRVPSVEYEANAAPTSAAERGTPGHPRCVFFG